jgi:hypothetical protein
MNPDQYSAESDPVAAVLAQDDLDAVIAQWLQAIAGDRAEVARDDRRPQPTIR